MLMFPLDSVFILSAGVNGNRCSESSTLLEKYRIGKVIGDGNFAVVKECMDR
jgi:doublecortin-like kinase 1/2